MFVVGPLVKSLISSRMKTADFRMIKVIGRGACGEVQLVRHIRTQKVFAMKRLEKSEVVCLLICLVLNYIYLTVVVL